MLSNLAQRIARSFPNRIHFNWDLFENRRLLAEKPSFFEEIQRKDGSTPLVIFDEIHKYRRWKNYLKGVYDQFSGEYKFLVLGSGRLNLFQKGGDSLAGRFQLERFRTGRLHAALCSEQGRGGSGLLGSAG